MNIPPPITLLPGEPEFGDQVSALPQRPGLYCLLPAHGSPHLGRSANLAKRLRRMLIGKAEVGGTAASELRLRLQRVECWPTTSKLENALLMYNLARRLFPRDYAKQLRLRLSWFLGIVDNDGFPRLAVTNRSSRRYDTLWGPFVSREAAEFYQEEVLRLFQIRRCTEALQPSPGHPGCIYGEINQCVRPCQCAVTRQEYAAEFGRVSEFIQSNGKAVLSGLNAARTSASENMEFEQAALIHKRIDQVKAALGARDDFVTEVHNFNGVAVTVGRLVDEVRLWPMLEGCWQEPIDLDVSAERAATRSLDAELKELLTQAGSSSSVEGDPFEQLSLFLRWYRSSWRDGAWVGFSSLAALNYRRLVREISKVAKPKAPVD